MSASFNLLSKFFSEAWVSMVGAILIMSLLGLLSHLLKGTFSAALGFRYGFAHAVTAAVGITAIVIFTFLGLPEIIQAANESLIDGASCGPLADLGDYAARFIAMIASIRILWAVTRSTAVFALAGSGKLESVLIDAGEAVLGMWLAASAGPIAAHFLGIC